MSAQQMKISTGKIKPSAEGQGNFSQMISLSVQTTTLPSLEFLEVKLPSQIWAS